MHPSKVKGTRYERDLTAWLRNRGVDSERLRETGVEDEGDILVRTPRRVWPSITVIEAKAENRIDIPGYLRELDYERLHYAAHRNLNPLEIGGLVIMKRRLAPIGKSYVVTTLEEVF